MRLAAALALGALLIGCSRSLPGPEECRAFALNALPVTSPLTPSQLGLLQDRVETLTQECLTTPYDKETLRCAELTRRPRECVLRLKQRQVVRQRSGSPLD